MHNPLTDLNILLTGASGFVGQAVLQHLIAYPGVTVRASGRQPFAGLPDGVAFSQIEDLLSTEQCAAAVRNINVVIHTAARVHIMQEKARDPLAEFRRVNVAGTLNLARQAAAAGVQRFIFLSSIKVNGEATAVNSPFTAEDTPAPLDAYGVSKLEAEIGLREIAKQSGMEVVIIRPPLIYGPGVKANFFAMMKWVYRGVPLPLGAIHNRRSLVSINNLVDLIIVCVTHPAAANQVFLVSDNEDISTTELLCHLGVALNKPARLIPIPAWLLLMSMSLLGQAAVAKRLGGSLQVDISKTQNLLGWHPPFTLAEGLRCTVSPWLVLLHSQ